MASNPTPNEINDLPKANPSSTYSNGLPNFNSNKKNPNKQVIRRNQPIIHLSMVLKKYLTKNKNQKLR
jgi:hypothetical protein